MLGMGVWDIYHYNYGRLVRKCFTGSSDTLVPSEACAVIKAFATVQNILSEFLFAINCHHVTWERR